MGRKRCICVFTASRADYRPLSPLIRRLSSDDEIDLRILASGSHLVPEHGMTFQEIEDDGYTIDERVDMALASDTPPAVAKSFGLACIGYAEAFERISPDLLLILGDRYEVLAAATTAQPRLLPVAHIGGGQLTQGSTDDQTRHAISKLSHLHFTFAADDRQRLIRMGEHPKHVHHVGTISADDDVPEPQPPPGPKDQPIENALNHVVEILGSTDLQVLTPKKYFNAVTDIAQSDLVF